MSTLPLVAGSAVLDLVNTVSWRGDAARRQDHLQDTQSCLTWALRAGVLEPAEAADLQGLLRRRPEAGHRLTSGLRELRTVVADTVLASVGEAPTQAREAIVEAFAHARLVDVTPSGPDPDRRVLAWRVTVVDEHVVRRRLALELEQLLTSPRGRLSVCADDDCQWVFLDVSRGRNRQWCSPGDCGNRNRVRRHQRRRQTGDA